MSGAPAPGRFRLRRALVPMAALALCAGCAAVQPAPTEAPPPATAVAAPLVISPAVVLPGSPVPAPSESTVLTVSGKISSTNGDRTLRFDQATLDQLGVVEVQVFEPWVKQNLQFQGVWLADLLRVAELDGSAQTLHFTALDDYQIDLKVADVMAGGVLLATRTGEGTAIPVEDGGPTRIIFVDGVLSGVSPEQWIWSLSTIDVR